jgi:hypothetical protein
LTHGGVTFTTNDATVLAALAGALVGGVATLGGSIIVERKKIAREQRIRIYDDLLPATRREVGWPSDEGLFAVEQVLRAATIAGRKERNLAREAQEMYFAAFNVHQNAATVMTGEALTTRRSKTPEAEQAFQKASFMVLKKLEELRKRVETKIR